MQSEAYPYLIPYLSIFLFFMLAAHRQILFWLYLWQLKEYHPGRFLAHFETAKGKSIFLNKRFIFKLLLAAAAGYCVFFPQNWGIYLAGSVFAVLGLQALRAAWGILRRNLLHPQITKKAALVLVASHVAVYGLALAVFGNLLGEMSLGDLFLAAFLLLLLDILLPVIIGLTVLVLQPLTVWEKRRLLRRAAALISKRPDLVTVGITGSYGKSSVKEFLAAVLETKFKVLKTPANLNTEVGISQTVITGLNPEHQIFICEIGAVHKGMIRQVAAAVKPRIGIVTGINQQHLAVFGSQQKIIEGKFELLEALPGSGTSILNWDSEILRQGYESQKSRAKTRKIVRCSTTEQRDVWAEGIEASRDHLSFAVKSNDGDSASVMLRLLGRQNAMPILLAAAAAKDLGMSLREISSALAKIDISKFGLQASRNSRGLNIISSTYSTNPDAVVSHLDYLKLWPDKKAVIMPCIIELGKSSKEIHFKTGQKIGKVCDFAVIATKDRFKEIKKGAISAGMKPENIIFSDRPEAINELIKTRLSSGDAILLEGRLPQSIAGLFDIKK